MALVTEDLVEHQTIDWFKEIGYQYACGYDIALDGDTPEREDYTSVILKGRCLAALQRLNPDIPQTSIENALSQLLNLHLLRDHLKKSVVLMSLHHLDKMQLNLLKL